MGRGDSCLSDLNPVHKFCTDCTASIFEVEVKDYLCSGCYRLYYLPIRRDDVEMAWRNLGASWAHIVDFRAVDNATLFTATDFAVPVLRHLFEIEPSEKILEAWSEDGSKRAQSEFLHIAVGVSCGGNSIVSGAYQKGVGLYGLAQVLANLKASARSDISESLQQLEGRMVG